MSLEASPSVDNVDEQPSTKPDLTVLDGGKKEAKTAPLPRSESVPQVTNEEMQEARALIIGAGHEDRSNDDRYVKNFARAYFYTSKETETNDQLASALSYAEQKLTT